MKEIEATGHASSQEPFGAPGWAGAPPGWNWLAQDADGRWFWYRTEPQLNWPGGVWRSNSRNQQFAAQGAPDPRWDASLRVRPGEEGG